MKKKGKESVFEKKGLLTPAVDGERDQRVLLRGYRAGGVRAISEGKRGNERVPGQS